eukprot:3564520-Rhodomonas_salina.1
MDLAGPVTPAVIGGYLYFMVLLDDATKRCWVYLLKQKSDSLQEFKHFCTVWGDPDALKTDNAPELKY